MKPELTNREPTGRPPSVRRREWLVIAAVYLVVTLYFILQGVLPDLTLGRPVNWQREVLGESVYWLIWAAITPFILAFTRRLPLHEEHRWRNLGAHLLLVLLVAPFQDGLWRSFMILGVQDETLRQVAEDWPLYGASWLAGSLTSFYKYWMIVGVYTSIDFYRKYRRQEREALDLRIRTAELETRLTNARLEALRMQLHPHFLFNTLNAISVLISDGYARKARQMLLRLSDLLRVTLDQAGEADVPLKQELEFLETYLEIERIRFEDRLQVRLDIEPETLDIPVPYLILQPIVENAVKHGVTERLGAGEIVIRSAVEDGRATLEVRDSGPGFEPDMADVPIDGVGLSNTRERLQKQFGDEHSIEFSRAAEGGLCVTISIPDRR